MLRHNSSRLVHPARSEQSLPNCMWKYLSMSLHTFHSTSKHLYEHLHNIYLSLSLCRPQGLPLWSGPEACGVFNNDVCIFLSNNFAYVCISCFSLLLSSAFPLHLNLSFENASFWILVRLFFSMRQALRSGKSPNGEAWRNSAVKRSNLRVSECRGVEVHKSHWISWNISTLAHPVLEMCH